MILGELRDYLRERRQATLADLANHFRASPEAVRGMLDFWVRKGCISRHAVSAACGSSCRRCAIEVTEIYAWRDGERVAVNEVIMAGDCSRPGGGER